MRHAHTSNKTLKQDSQRMAEVIKLRKDVAGPKQRSYKGRDSFKKQLDPVRGKAKSAKEKTEKEVLDSKQQAQHMV